MGAALFRRAGSKGQVSRRVSACVEENSSSVDGAVECVSHTSSVDSNNLRSGDLLSNDESKGKNGSHSDTGYSSLSDNVRESFGFSSSGEVVTEACRSDESNNAERRSQSNDNDTDLCRVASESGEGRTGSIVANAAALDRFRSRVGSIVRPSGSTLLSSGSLQQQPFESSAGLLMTSQYDGRPAPLSEECEDLDSVIPLDSSPGNPRRSRGRSGSCSDFSIPPRLAQHEKSAAYHAPHSPKASVEPGSPKTPNPSEHFKLLMRSESFANDAGILEKLNKLKLGLSASGDDGKSSANYSHGSNGPCETSNNLRNIAFPRATTSVSKALFGRRGSFNFRRSQNSESRESLSENPDDRSSAENSRGGSTDDLDSLGSQHTTPTRRLLASWNNQWNNSQWGSRLWGSRDVPTSEQQITEASNACGEASPVKSLPKSPARTPVTENDPLGALVSDLQNDGQNRSPGHEAESSEDGNNLSIGLDEDGNPILFGGRRAGKADKGVARSATFHDDERVAPTIQSIETSDDSRKSKSMQRSSTITMPVDAQIDSGTGSSVVSSIGSLGSSFKLPFSRAPVSNRGSSISCLEPKTILIVPPSEECRYSPGRFSLRKADLRIGQQIIENAITNFSPSSLTSKKSSELIMGGLNSLKSAATSVAKKFDEIKEAVSANNTPIKASNVRDRDREGSYYEEDPPDTSTIAEEGASSSRSRKVSSEFSPSAVTQNLEYWGSNLIGDLFGDNSRKGSSSNLQPLGETSSLTSQQIPVFPENLYSKPKRDPRIPIAMKLVLTTCSKCHNCGCIIYDEEIMAGWSPEDSNLNTKCQFCEKATVPFLTVTIMDYRSNPMAVTGLSQESLHSSPKRKNSGSLSVRASWLSVNSGSLLSVAETEEEMATNGAKSFIPELTPVTDPLGVMTIVPEITPSASPDCEDSATAGSDTPTIEVVSEPYAGLNVSSAEKDTTPIIETASSSSVEMLNKAAPAVTGSDAGVLDPSCSGNDVTLETSVTSGALDQESKTDEEPITLELITVPYLNPLVLRKELENILHAEGDICLTRSCFVDEHPIIYWNMVWAMERIAVESHLPGLCLQAGTVLRQQTNVHFSWAKADHRHVFVRCMWDNPRLHEEVGLPMYVLWQQDDQHSALVSALLTDRTTVSRPVMKMVISSIRCNDLLEPLKRLATERHKLKGRGVTRSHSIYRDILFLAFTVLGRENIHQASFDREYENAFENLPKRDLKLYLPCDQPVSIPSLCCRHYFRELEL